MNSRLRINGQPDGGLQSNDRGFAYGDGLFETIWLGHGHAPLWQRHMQRLAVGCQRLRLPNPDPDRLWREVAAVAGDLPQAVVRLTWSRGSGPRGYALPETVQPTCVVSAAPATPWPGHCYEQGIALHECATRLAVQPALAGMKHLNRLEQVLARAEWSDPGLREGMMRDTAGRVVSATSANLFIVRDGHVVTPDLSRCGVAGTARSEVLAQWTQAGVADLTAADLKQADEVFITSAVRGIVPVTRMSEWTWSVGDVTHALQTQWRDTGLPPREII